MIFQAMRIKNSTILLVFSFIVSACVPMHYAMKDHAIICPDSANDHVDGNVSTKNSNTTKKITVRLEPSISISDKPINSSTFWVRINPSFQASMNANIDNDNAGPPIQDIPVLYSTEFTYVEKEDGTKIAAEPEIYLDTRNKSFPSTPDSPENAALDRKIINLNSYEMIVSRQTAVDPARYTLYFARDMYIVFNTPPPLPTSQWKLQLGKITLGDETLKIPERRTCYFKGYSQWRFEPLIRP